MILGLSGYAQAGKDTVAAVLVEHHGYRRAAFADALRDAALALNPIVSWDQLLDRPIRYGDLIREGGYEEAKRLPEVRQFLQRLGTDMGRQILGDNVWVDLVWRGMEPGGQIVFTDVRFPNEAQSIVDHGGLVVRVERPGCGAVNGHASETALDGWPFDLHLLNDGGLDELPGAVDRLLESTR